MARSDPAEAHPVRPATGSFDVLMLVTDAFGGHGGIACYNRCLAEALASLPAVRSVTVLPRVMRFASGPLPAKVRSVDCAVGSKPSYVRHAMIEARRPVGMVFCGHINLLPLAAAIAALKRVPLVLQVHGIEAWAPAPWWQRLALSRVDAIWSVSGVTRDRMNAWAQLPLDRYTVIPNTYKPEQFGIAPRRADLQARYGLQGRKVIVTLARLAGRDRHKGIDETLEALPELLKKEPRLSYLILGDGDDQARLQAKAEALGLRQQVVFAGLIAEAEKADHLRLADVFCLPGRAEGFGIVYLEALACGVPVVGSLLDGSHEALREGELGELVDPDQPGSVKRGIERAMLKSKTIPSGLDYFSFVNFKRKVGIAIDTRNLTSAARQR